MVPTPTSPESPARRPGRRWVRILHTATLVVLTILVAAATFAVVRADRMSPNGPAVVADSLEFLGSALAAGTASDAQASFPEGYFFAHVLYGLAGAEAAGDDRLARATARSNGRVALDAMTGPEGTAPFDRSLDPPYGIFHAGWTLLLQAKLAGLLDRVPGAESTSVGELADAVAAAFTTALDAERSPFLPAYPGQSWPVDSVVAIAGLRAADEVTGDDHGELIERWVGRALELVDPRTELLPHRTDPASGALVEGTRGSSQSLIQRMWPTVSPKTADASYLAFRDQFVDTRLGFVGVVEFPAGVDGRGDVDSGPLILGFSASATVVAIGAALAHGDGVLAYELEREADTFGVPITLDGKRRYAFGLLPIGDAFVTWSRAAPFPMEQQYASLGVWWQVYPVAGWLVVGALWIRRWQRHRRRT